jgi:RNA polymerase I-specific transcription initiation factor RRN3
MHAGLGPYTPASRPLASLEKSSTPVKSILKPGSVLGRRKAQHDDAESSDTTESPTKRRRVLFDELRNVTHEFAGRSMQDIKFEVRTALENHLRGNDGQYDSLKELFANDKQKYLPPVVGEADDTLKPHELQAYIMALTSCVPVLKDRRCNGLVKTILKCSWLGRDDAFLKKFTHFLAALISAQGSYMTPVLSMMVEKFADTRPSSWSVPDFPEINREAMRIRLHTTIQYLLQMFPAAKSVLETQLSAKFPYPDESLGVHMAYIHNLFRIKDYVPELLDDVLDLIVSRVVKIDSQMQLDLEDLDDDVTAAVSYSLRENLRQSSDWEDDEADDSDTESVDSDDPEFDQDAARIKTIKVSVEKMDAMLDTLFAYYTPLFDDPGSDDAFEAFTTIIREFEHMILPTYKSRHTQFLIFHFAQMHERLTDAFCGQLISIAFSVNTPNILKQAAAAYLASFVARGAHVPKELVRPPISRDIHSSSSSTLRRCMSA